jgi:hypothetical protein
LSSFAKHVPAKDANAPARTLTGPETVAIGNKSVVVLYAAVPMLIVPFKLRPLESFKLPSSSRSSKLAKFDVSNLGGGALPSATVAE